MKKALKLTLLLVSFLMFNLTSNAQEGSRPRKQLSPEERADKKATYLKGKLNLDETQTANIKAIFLKNEQEKSEVRDNRKEKMIETDKQITSFLNKDQAEKFRQMKEERKEKMKNRRGEETQNPPAQDSKN
jgi:Spy/CpxP family protein refolding chaperone